jgi:hypothetical protein
MNKYDQKSKAGSSNRSGANSAPDAANLRPYNQRSDYSNPTSGDARQSEPTQPQAEAGQASHDAAVRAPEIAAQNWEQDNRGNLLKTSARVDASFEDGQRKI